MDEREANIDLLFRNGLKDYEVLPPSDVWNNITPAVRIKPRSFALLKAAAVIAVVFTISFLAVRLTKEIPEAPYENFVALNVTEIPPLHPITGNIAYDSKASEKQPFEISRNVKFQEASDNVIASGNETFSNEEIKIRIENDPLLPGKDYLQHSRLLTEKDFSKNKTFELSEIDPQYFPSSEAVNNTERWSIAAMASPTYYSSFTSGENDLAKQLASSEQSLISYSGGVAVSYKINKRFSIQTGVYYSSQGKELEGVSSFGGFLKYDNTKGDSNFELLTSSGSVFTNNPDVFLIATGPGERIITPFTNDVFDPKKANLEYISNSLQQNFSYLELPVVLRYKLIDKSIDFSVTGGLSYNMLLNNTVYVTSGSEKIQVATTSGLNPLTLSSSLGMGMEYSFSKKLSLNLEPTFRYFLNPFNSAAGSNNHTYSFGLFSGISYKF